MSSTPETTEIISGAEYVIGKFGGLAATARAIGKPVSTVQGWSERKRIPQDHWHGIIDAAKARDKLIVIEDFIRTHPAPSKEEVA
jgi:hypothetical protein